MVVQCITVALAVVLASGCGRIAYGPSDSAETSVFDARLPDAAPDADASGMDAAPDSDPPADGSADVGGDAVLEDTGLADVGDDVGEPDAGLPPLPEVAVGGVSTCVRNPAGGVRCIGCNGSGSLGDGTGVDSTAFVDVVGITEAVGLWSGDEHSCVLSRTEGAVCWGWNTDGSLGDGTSMNALAPVVVGGISGDIAQLAPARTATCAGDTRGGVFCFGDNFFGQLGNGTLLDSSTPTPVMGLPPSVEVAGAEGHFCARTRDGAIYCWGWGSSGQLGNGTNIREQPTAVRAGTIDDAVAMTVGHSHSCAVRSTGELWCWGANDSGQLGDGTYVARNVPGRVMGLTNVVGVSAGYVHTCARLDTGGVRCFGWSGDGSIGDGQTSVDRLLPEPVVGLTDAVQISSSTIGGPTCAVRRTGHIVCWGNNDCGQLMTGTRTSSSVPVPLSGFAPP